MHIQSSPNTVPCTVSVVESLTPQRGTCKAVESKTWCPFWKDGLVQCNVALQSSLRLRNPDDTVLFSSLSGRDNLVVDGFVLAERLLQREDPTGFCLMPRCTSVVWSGQSEVYTDMQAEGEVNDSWRPGDLNWWLNGQQKERTAE